MHVNPVTQKFVVLFVQIAVRDGSLLERLNTSESVNIGCRVVSIKGHLHGPLQSLAHRNSSGRTAPRIRRVPPSGDGEESR